MANNLQPRTYSADLYQYCLKKNLQVGYEEVSVTGPPHNLEFTMKAVVGDREFPEGKGRSKKEAKNDAARLALDILENEAMSSSTLPVSPQSPEASETKMSSSTNYIAFFNTYKQQKKVTLDFVMETVFEPSGIPRFSCKYIIGEKMYDAGWGSNKQEAKQSAAKKAYEQLILGNNSQDMSSFMSPQLSQPSRVSESKTALRINYIDPLNHYAQKNGFTLNFQTQTKLEPSGLTSFSSVCKIGDTSYGPATGSSKKEAKQGAAKIACEMMKLGDASLQKSYSVLSSAYATLQTDSSKTSPGPSTLNGVVSERGFSEDSSERNSNGSLQNISSYSLKSTGSSQQKCKRPLAATFDRPPYNNEKKECSNNERFLKDFSDITLLNSGGYGQVFKGTHRIDRNSYAIKRVVFDNEKVRREVETLAKLDHENIVKYKHCWVGDDNYDPERSGGYSRSKINCLFIVMEFCEGGTLKDWIDRERCNEPDKALSLNLFQQITAGVEYIHSEKLIHRDLKPSNIFLVDKTKIKIGDFGLVTSLKNFEDRTKGVGTPSYMSPEQRNVQAYGNEVDIFALGLILFELLYICPTAQEMSRIWDNVKNCVFPEEFGKKYLKEKLILMKLLSKNPEDRPKASKILKILKSWEKEECGREPMHSHSY
ncbi:interferon-induced, double-stranded RNA-activated protein kinase [Trichosurus vulpecula]|uniref:interferon-induced, double-stranded RNA-activated protein kinase n=1 Tax=Trichosurus vulpecula TaxID=9337 RepID=UPI00186AE0CA|nr:interferon-induced, double-stranded RNA-activated protein kinase [Trichosurus vulpecula]